MIIYIVLSVVSFLGGFYAGFKNASSAKVNKVSEILKALKGK